MKQTSSDPSKGSSLLELTDNYTVLDLETTGLDPRRCRIIEFGIVRVRDSRVTDRFTSLADPGEPLDAYITALTGITDDMLSGAPSLTDALHRALDFIGDDIVVGHNVNFDIGFMCASCRELTRRTFPNDYIDTMRLSRRLFPEHGHHRLCDLTERFGIPAPVSHRALADAEQTQGCYEYMKNYMREFSLTPQDLLGRRGRVRDIRQAPAVSAENAPEFVFTGVLAHTPRAVAVKMVLGRGWIAGDHVTEKTNYLVLGTNEYDPGNDSKKLLQALRLQRSGFPLRIIDEEDFLKLVR